MEQRASHTSPKADPASQAGFPPPEADTAILWSQIRDLLAASLPDATFRMWLEPVRPLATRGRTLYLEAPDNVRNWVELRYADLIETAARRVTDTVDGVSFAPAEPEESGTGPSHSTVAPNPTHTFDRFVIGQGNHLAHAAALAVAEAPAEAYNPLFIHGSPGLGKTHLLGAIANYLAGNAPELEVVHTTAEAFTNEFVASLRQSGVEEFKRRHRDVDVLLVDDVQFLAGKERTEEEFFHTFNALHDAGSQIVITADRIPSEISSLTERLRDRFEWGLTVPIEQPDLPTRLTVLRRLVVEAGLELTDNEALNLLARKVETNIRQLHGALTRTIAHASLRSAPLDSDLISQVFPGQERSREPLSPERIRQLVAGHFGVPEERLASGRRDARTVRARHIAIYFTRELTDLSLPQIADLYGKRDHTTVLNSVRRVAESISTDPELAMDVDSCRRAMEAVETAGHDGNRRP